MTQAKTIDHELHHEQEHLPTPKQKQKITYQWKWKQNNIPNNNIFKCDISNATIAITTATIDDRNVQSQRPWRPRSQHQLKNPMQLTHFQYIYMQTLKLENPTRNTDLYFN